MDAVADDIQDNVEDMTYFPDAIIDLKPGSVIQTLMDNATYPDGHRQPRWHPIVGIAYYKVPSGGWRDIVWDGAFRGASGLVGVGWEELGNAVDQVNATEGDLVVDMDSQANGNPLNVGSVFVETKHSGPPITVAGHVIKAELDRESIAARVRELLVSDPSGVQWSGDLSQ